MTFCNWRRTTRIGHAESIGGCSIVVWLDVERRKGQHPINNFRCMKHNKRLTFRPRLKADYLDPGQTHITVGVHVFFCDLSQVLDAFQLVLAQLSRARRAGDPCIIILKPMKSVLEERGVKRERGEGGCASLCSACW